MSADHDPNLSLFGDLPPPPAPPAPEKPKRTRVSRTPKNVAPDAVGPDADAQVQPSAGAASTPVVPAATPEGLAPAPSTAPSLTPSPRPVATPAPVALAASEAIAEVAPKTPAVQEDASPVVPTPAPQRRRSSPWAAHLASQSAAPLASALTPKPHVLMVITKGEMGGAQNHILTLCAQLQDKVNLRVVIGGAAGSWLEHQLSVLGVSCHALPEMVETLWPWQLWPAARRLIALIESEPPDLIHTHSAIASLLARIASRHTRRPVVYTVHGFGFKPQVPWLRRQLVYWAERAVAGMTTQMICVSNHERGLAYQLPIDPRRVHVVRNGLTPLEGPLQEPHADAQKPLRVLMIARMKAPKRHDLLLQALVLVRERLGHELPLTFAGDGPLRERLEAQAQHLGLQEVVWAGDVDAAHLLLPTHDVLVLASDHEGLPLTVLEGMRAGRAVVASDLPGVRELLVHNQEGLICANTPEAFAEQLLRLQHEPYLARRLGRAAQAHFQQQFTATAMGQKTWQVYGECLQEAAATTRPVAALGSALTRERDRLLNWCLAGAWLLLPSLWVAQLLQQAEWVTYQFATTLWWCVIPYILACQFLMRNAMLPLAERTAVLGLATFVPFALTPLGFAIVQQPYSRAAVLWAFVVSTLWLAWGYQRRVKPQALRLLALDERVPELLTKALAPDPVPTERLQWVPWQPQSHSPLPACDGVVLDRHQAPSSARTAMMGQLKMQHLRFYTVETIAEWLSGRRPSTADGDDALWAVDHDPAYDRAKRLMDVLTVCTLAPLWLPLAFGVALAVRLDSPGPVLFGQDRVGRDGRVFRLWKFRSMVHGLQAPGVHFAQADDPRITRVGRFIRRSRLDELPQLWNVLWGEMSLIGPRPEQVPLVREFATTLPSYPYRHLVRPGLTGWAQVQQGYADSLEGTRLKLSYDLYYVTHYSLALDLLIAAKTLHILVSGKGAR